MRLSTQATVQRSFADALRKARKAITDGDRAAFLRQVDRLGLWDSRDQSAYGEWKQPDVRPTLNRGAKVFFGGVFHPRMARWFSDPSVPKVKGVKRISYADRMRKLTGNQRKTRR